MITTPAMIEATMTPASAPEESVDDEPPVVVVVVVAVVAPLVPVLVPVGVAEASVGEAVAVPVAVGVADTSPGVVEGVDDADGSVVLVGVFVWNGRLVCDGDKYQNWLGVADAVGNGVTEGDRVTSNAHTPLAHWY